MSVISLSCLPLRLASKCACVACLHNSPAYRRPADGNRCSFFAACLLHLKLNTMPLQGDNNIFCALQIFPATRAEAVLFCFSSQELIAHECSGDVLINFSLCLGCFRILEFVETPFVCSVCTKCCCKIYANRA